MRRSKRVFTFRLFLSKTVVVYCASSETDIEWDLNLELNWTEKRKRPSADKAKHLFLIHKVTLNKSMTLTLLRNR